MNVMKSRETGLVFVVAGLMGSVLGGVVLDRTKKFKLVTVITYIATLGFLAIFAGLLTQSNILLDYTLLGILV